MKKCPRCDSKKAGLLTKAPVDDAWEVYLCETCHFTWRNTEADSITKPKKYDARFKLNPADFDKLGQIPPIPELKK